MQTGHKFQAPRLVLVGPTVLAMALLVVGSAAASAAENESDETPGWSDFADCAAGYLANWQDRLTSPQRTREMSAMIHAQSDDYKTAAAHVYKAQFKATDKDSVQAVDAYVQKNLARFVAMDKAGKLESFIDDCPQPDEASQD